MIAVSVQPVSFADAQQLLPRAEAEGDLVELRADLLEASHLAALLADRRAPVIVTDRAAREGGRSRRDDAARVALLREAARHGAAYVDLELSCGEDAIAALRAALAAGGGATRLILSWHDPRGTPPAAALAARLHDAHRLGADVAKLVPTATAAADAQRVLALYAPARALALPLIAFCQGEAGRESRVESLRRGAPLGYARLASAAATAAGQWSARALAERLQREPRRFAVLGDPVRHSLSPAMFNAAFAALGLRATYEARAVDGAPEAAQLLRSGELDGASVTMPLKTAIVPLVDDLDDEARAIGAVNTLWLASGRLCGGNTDALGLAASLRERVTLAGATVAILGAGGAARAAVHAVAAGGGRPVVLCRAPHRATGWPCPVRPLAELPSVGADGVISAIPLADEGPVPAAALAGIAWVLDMVYRPRATRLLADARAAGCLAISGDGMLVHQGAAQFARWFDRPAPVDLMAAAVARELAQAPA